MGRIASRFLLQSLKGSMSGDARGFNSLEARAVVKFFFLQDTASKKIHAILTNIRGTGPIVCHQQKLGGPL